MKISELKKLLNAFPQNMEVLVSVQDNIFRKVECLPMVWCGEIYDYRGEAYSEIPDSNVEDYLFDAEEFPLDTYGEPFKAIVIGL